LSLLGCPRWKSALRCAGGQDAQGAAEDASGFHRGFVVLESGLPHRAEDYGLPAGAIAAVPARGQRLYRLASDPPETRDFESRLRLGRRPFTDEWPILHAGASMFVEMSQARSRGRRSPVVIAEVYLEEGQGLYLAKTLTSPGHYTVWGDPEVLLHRAHVVYAE
jgi:hypothetical protein